MTGRGVERRRVLGAGSTLATLLGSGCLRLAESETTSTTGESTTDAPTETEETTETGAAPAADLTPVFRHPLDGSFDDPVNGLAGEPAGSGVGFGNGRGGTVLQLRGRGSGVNAGYYDVSYQALGRHLEEGDPITAALWIAPNALDDWYATFVGTGLALALRDGSLRLFRYDRATGRTEYMAEVDAATVLTPGEWRHVVATVEPGAQARLFVDGERVAVTRVDADQGYQEKQGLENVRVGFVASGDDGAYDAHYEGDVDDIRFYRGSVEAAGARALYESMR